MLLCSVLAVATCDMKLCHHTAHVGNGLEVCMHARNMSLRVRVYVSHTTRRICTVCDAPSIRLRLCHVVNLLERH